MDNATFKPEVEENEYLFILVQEPVRKPNISKFEGLYRQHNIRVSNSIKKLIIEDLRKLF